MFHVTCPVTALLQTSILQCFALLIILNFVIIHPVNLRIFFNEVMYMFKNNFGSQHSLSLCCRVLML